MDSGIGGDMQFSTELGDWDGGSSRGLSSGNSNSMDSMDSGIGCDMKFTTE